MLFTKLKLISVTTVLLTAAATGAAALVPLEELTGAGSARSSGGPEPSQKGVPTEKAPPARKPAKSKAKRAASFKSGAEAKGIVQSGSNLKSIALGVHAYMEANANAFPTPAISSEGKPLLSWRVAILPYIGETEKALYSEFKLDEPWDSPHNKALLSRMPKIYAPVVKPKVEKYETYYQGFVGTGALFEERQKVGIAGVTDGTVNTLMVVEAEKPVPWTKPEDLSFDPNKPLPKLGGQFKAGFAAATADGAIHFIQKTIDPSKLKSLITRNGGEIGEISDVSEAIQVPG